MRTLRGQWIQDEIHVTDATNIIDIVAIWEAKKNQNIYILRKHPGLAILRTEECGQEFDDGNGSDDDNSDMDNDD